jgi:hypothetical protein
VLESAVDRVGELDGTMVAVRFANHVNANSDTIDIGLSFDAMHH